MLQEKVLIVDDEEGVRNTLTSILEDEGYEVDSVDSGEECLNMLNRSRFQAVMLDVWLPGIDGVETLRRMRSAGVEAAVVMISGHGTVETAVRATKLGAFDFIEKPLSLEKIILVLKNAIRHKKLLEKHTVLKEQLRKNISLIGVSNAISRLMRDVAAIGPTDSPVLIIGENGSGKELVARLIHFQSARSDEAFISINCAAFEKDLLEQELFGFEPGAFSWAPRGRKGKFEMANEGTIFLDEITSASGRVQQQLLRIFEEKSLETIGSEKVMRIDVRIIAASARELHATGTGARLSEDLIDRLNVVSLHIPPLRERREDVPLLIEHFLKEFSYEYGRNLKTPTKEALEKLISYSWPGNVRELKNAIERLVIMLKKDMIELQDLPESIRCESIPSERKEFMSYQEALSEFEKKYLWEVLRYTQFDLERASEILMIEKKVVEQKMKMYGIS